MAVTKLPYTPRPHALSYHARSQRFAVLIWHRRAGKTVMCITDLIEKAMRNTLPMPEYGYVAPFRNQAKNVAWKYLMFLSEPVREYKNEAELYVRLVNGAKIRLYGADNAESMRGGYFDGVVVDEYGDIPESVYSSIIRPMLADRGGWCTFIGTPKGMNHFHDLWQLRRDDPNWFTCLLKATESTALPPEELAEAEREYAGREEEFEQEFLCSFTAANRGAFYATALNDLEAQGHMGIFQWDADRAVVAGMDIGITDDTSIWFAQIHGRAIYLIDFWTGAGYSADEVMDVLEAKPYVYEPFLLPHDAARLSQTSGKTFQQVFKARGARSRIVTSLPVQAGINAVRQTLPRMYFDISNKAIREDGLRALRMYSRRYDDRTKAYLRTPRHDWSSNPADGFRYLCIGLTDARTTRLDRGLAIAEQPVPDNLLTLDESFAAREKRRATGRI